MAKKEKRQEQDRQYELELNITPALEAAVENAHGAEARDQLLRHEPTHSRLELESMLSRALEVLTSPEQLELFEFFGIENDSNPEPVEDGGKPVKPSTKRVRRMRLLERVRQYSVDQGWGEDGAGIGWGRAA